MSNVEFLRKPFVRCFLSKSLIQKEITRFAFGNDILNISIHSTSLHEQEATQVEFLSWV